MLPERPKDKKKRADSFDKDEPMEDEEEEDGFDGKAYDDLTKEQKYDVLQQLYQQYQQDPESFPEDQRELLERELENLFGEGEEEEMDSDDAWM